MTRHHRKHLIVFAKQPLPGYAKTRLGADLGVDQSAGVYARLLYSYLHSLMSLDFDEYLVELKAAEVEDVLYFKHAFPEFLVREQSHGNLGQRIAAAFEQAFEEGSGSVVLTGSDIPDLNSDVVGQAFECLEEHQVVLGPSQDGGYYLIGMNSHAPELFQGIAWSTEHVLQQTTAILREKGLHTAHLRALEDIDSMDVYQRWFDARRVLRRDRERSAS
jgi:uncharacterized protein